MISRRLASAAALAAALTGTALTAPAAYAADPQSTVCTTAGSCVTVTKDGANHFTVDVTCKAKEVVVTGVRGYFADGNWTTSPPRLVTCSGAGAKPAPISRRYIGHSLVAHRAYLGLVPVKFGPSAGAAVPGGGHEIKEWPGSGFHWD